MDNNITWAREYGDEEQWGRFAGRFAGYDPTLKSPSQKVPSDKPIVLLMADSIFGGNIWRSIQKNIESKAYLSYIQHPHHSGNIEKWLNIWDIENWDHYKILFNFEGLHGFPPRQTFESHKQDTLNLVRKYKKIFPIVIWGNMTPVPEGFITGQPNNNNGPNSIEQDVRDDVVIRMNSNLSDIMSSEKIPFIDLYSIIKSNNQFQVGCDLHLTPAGGMAISAEVSKVLLNYIEKKI